METMDAHNPTDAVATTGVAVPLAKLTDTQVFARDPEDYTTENVTDTIARLSKIVARQRKARQDEADVLAQAQRIKKTNAAARKKKAPADPMETKL
jgi:hypothetical protein